MTCTCGFSFAHDMFKNKKRRAKTYAVIDDKRYRKVMKIEAKALGAKSKKKRWKHLAKASTLVGTMHVCPECGLHTILMPGAKETRRLTPVEPPNEAAPKASLPIADA